MKQKLNLRFCMTLLMGILMSVSAFAQNITVRGNVKDNLGEVVGATVLQKGTSNGCTTDLNGDFTLSVPRGATLVISFVGYVTQEVTAAPNLSIMLQEDSKLLNEQVVIGYGTVKKNDLTGSVVAVKPDDMNHGLQTSAQDMIQGKIAGVSVVPGDGTPGGAASIRIRGGSSLNASNDPLIVVDGLSLDAYGANEGSANALTMINPADIESFTVLKDASAAAIYGSRASNGVIIITTKKGKANSGPKVSYNGNVSFSVNTKRLEVMDSKEFQSFAQKLFGYAGDDAGWKASSEYANLGYYDAQGNHRFADTDWQKEIYRTGISTDHNITVTGGLKNMPYRASVGYTHQDGTLKTSNFNRYTASLNLAPSFFEDHLKVNLNAKMAFARHSFAATSAVGKAIYADPTKPIYDERAEAYEYGGYWQWPVTADFGDTSWTHSYSGLNADNPIAVLKNLSNIGKSRDLMGNIEVDYKIHGFEDLHLHLNGGMDIGHGHSDKIVSPYDYSTNIYYGSRGWNEGDKYNLSFTGYAQYIKDLYETHHFDVMAGYEWQKFHRKTDYDYPKYYPTTHATHPGELYDPDYYTTKNSLYKTENYLVSFFGRFNYSLLDRYLVTFTLRDDGSSRFSKSNRWGVFPSAALAWKINEEVFLKNSTAVSDAKLRLGWGVTGQQEGSIGDYAYLPVFTTSGAGAYYPVTGIGVTYRPEAYNPDLKWEKTITYNVGLDFGFANNRFVGSVDYYYRKTNDLLNTIPLAAGVNFATRVMGNIGSLHNTGLEAQLTYRIIQAKDLRWEVSYNLTWNKNKIDHLVSTDGAPIGNAWAAVGGGGSGAVKAYAEGHPSSAFYVYQQVYDEAGKPIEGEFVDRNGDGVINEKDKYFYKKADADVLMGFSSKLIYKNWDFGFSLRASLNNYMYNSIEANDRANVSPSYVYSNNTWHNVVKYQLDKNWQYMSNIDSQSDYFIQNASFLKCDNITLGYSFNHIGKSNINGRLYATVQNVFTITDYKGIDPEVFGGYDSAIYPRPFTGIIGVSLNF